MLNGAAVLWGIGRVEGESSRSVGGEKTEGNVREDLSREISGEVRPVGGGFFHRVLRCGEVAWTDGSGPGVWRRVSFSSFLIERRRIMEAPEPAG